MTKQLNLLALCLGGALTVFAADSRVPATSTNQPLSNQIVSEARSAGKVAGELAAALKANNADATKITDSAAAIEKSLGEINRLAAQLDTNRASMKAKQIENLDRMKRVSETIQVFVNIKKDVAAASSEEARAQLLDHALAVKLRAELIEKLATRIGG